MRPPIGLWLTSGLWAVSQQAQAQPAPTAPAAPTAVEAAPVKPADVQAAVPEIDDPMLDPGEPPKNIISSWRRALILVRANSTSLRSARARIAEASGRAQQAISAALPTLSATGSVDRHLLLGTGVRITGDGFEQGVQIPNPATIWTGRVSLQQPVLNFSTWHNIETARLGERAAELDAKDAERLALAQLAESVVSVFTAERLAETSRVVLRSSLETLDLTRRRARLGAATAVDVLRARQEVLINRTLVVQTKESLQKAREALGMALGYPEPWGVTPDLRLTGLARDAEAVCRPVTDVLDRADVHAAATRTEVAKRNRRNVALQYAPTLDFTSNFTYSTAVFTANARPMQWTVGALLTIPLFDGGMRNSQHVQLEAAQEVATQTLEDSKRRATIEATQATRSVLVARANLQVAQTTRDVSFETERLSRLSFLHGRGTSFDLIDAGRRYRQAEIDLAVKEFEVIRSELAAALALSNCDI